MRLPPRTLLDSVPSSTMNPPDNSQPPGKGQFLVYPTEDGRTKIEVRLENETVWLTQQHMAELFQTTQQNISLHLQNIYQEGELLAGATHKECLSVRREGDRNVTRSLRGLAGFAKALKFKYDDIEVGFDFDPEPGLADNGDLEHDLQALLEAAGAAAQQADTALVLFIDELQYVPEDELAALITALHRCAQRQLPVVLVGAGLPQLRGRMGRAKSYAERLFDFPEIGALPPPAAKAAIAEPAQAQGVHVTETALQRIVEATHGYPYFLQEWGKHSWDVAVASPIAPDHVALASRSAVAALDESFFRVRFDRLTPSERKHLRAMAELGPGPHRSGDIAEKLGRPVTALGPTRNQFISKGMVWSPSHGDTAFTVPLFDEFMRRIMPGDDWKQA